LALSCKYSRPLPASKAIFILVNQSNAFCPGRRSEKSIYLIHHNGEQENKMKMNVLSKNKAKN